MDKSTEPGALLYACTGALIGIFATLLVPPEGVPHFPKAITPLSLTSFAEDVSLAEPDPMSWTEDVQGVARAAMGLGVHTVKVRGGDTLADVLVKAGIDRAAAFGAVEAIGAVYNLKKLQVGQELELTYDALSTAGETTPLAAVNFEFAPGRSISVNRNDDGTFDAHEVLARTSREFVRGEGTITSTLFESAADQGIPVEVMTAMIKLFSYDVDFQRDIQRGDNFAVMYEHTVADDGRPVRNLDIRYASMTLSGTLLKFYAFRQEDGSIDYYTGKGEGIRKALMRTPVNGATLTSSFGMRRHPILGYSLMHRGVDFGAPPGTPIMAAGDGVIEKRERNTSYGNYIRIRHASGYATAYGHMSRFAPEFTAGKRVRQGQIIGFVGATGRATGPHLHFEIMQNAKQVNPISVKFPSSEKLAGATLAKFKRAQAEADQAFAGLERNPAKWASGSAPASGGH